MKNIMNYTIVVLLFGIVGCAKTPVTVDSDKTMTEVQNAIGKVYEIWETKDINSVKEIYAENVVGFGTDESEYWKGIDEFEPSIKTQMTAINNLDFDFKNETIHISPSGDMASYSHKVDITFTSQGEPGKLNDVRISGVLVKKGSSWKHVQTHWSIGVKGQVIEY
jgi:ketosteroid isomerase-like protein|tara:strand:- start:120 stop:614 length:495 start_codon:yes stop_codon:yes gene_type:complete